MTHFARKEIASGKETVFERVPGVCGEAYEGCENIVELARELHVSRRQLYGGVTSWIPRILGMEMSEQNARAFTLRKEVNHLKRVLAEKKFGLALKHVRRSARA